MVEPVLGEFAVAVVVDAVTVARAVERLDWDTSRRAAASGVVSPMVFVLEGIAHSSGRTQARVGLQSKVSVRPNNKTNINCNPFRCGNGPSKKRRLSSVQAIPNTTGLSRDVKCLRIPPDKVCQGIQCMLIPSAAIDMYICWVPLAKYCYRCRLEVPVCASCM